MRELDRLGREVRDELGEPSPAWLRRQQRDLTAALGVKSPKRAVAGWALAGALLTLAMAVAAVWVAAPLRHPAPSSATELALSASTDSRSVSLADGSSLLLFAHTRARVTAGQQATRCLLQVGKMQFDVAPQRGREFSVKAGAFEVTVVGTRFSVSRDVAGVVEIAVSHGVVRVKVPNRDSPAELRAGDQLRGEGEHVVVLHEPATAHVEQLASPLASVDALREAQPPTEAPNKPGGPPRDAWLRLYRAHDYAAALAAAREVGVDGLLGSLPAQPLAELGDAARLGGDDDLALRAFDALGRRFPASRQARDAMFLSGRVLASRGQHTAARRQFEAYVAGNARGGYLVEALGRLVEIYATTSDPRAKPTARTYLERAPHGPYRRLCLSVLAAP